MTKIYLPNWQLLASIHSIFAFALFLIWKGVVREKGSQGKPFLKCEYKTRDVKTYLAFGQTPPATQSLNGFWDKS